jgi:hypothetical protein
MPKRFSQLKDAKVNKDELRRVLIAGGMSQLEIDETWFLKVASEGADWETVPYMPRQSTRRYMSHPGYDEVEIIAMKGFDDEALDEYRMGDGGLEHSMECLLAIKQLIEQGKLKCFFWERAGYSHITINELIEDFHEESDSDSDSDYESESDSEDPN